VLNLTWLFLLLFTGNLNWIESFGENVNKNKNSCSMDLNFLKWPNLEQNLHGIFNYKKSAIQIRVKVKKINYAQSKNIKIYKNFFQILSKIRIVHIWSVKTTKSNKTWHLQSTLAKIYYVETGQLVCYNWENVILEVNYKTFIAVGAKFGARIILENVITEVYCTTNLHLEVIFIKKT
jgi:hypothetical protein